MTPLAESYGPGPRQVGEWWVPAGAGGALPTVVLLHGGFWRPSYDLHLEDAVAADLADRGFLVWNVDYATYDEPWPATLRDAAAAYDFALRGRFADRVDPTRVAVVGHSAGGHLALWLASRSRLPAGAPGAGAYLPPALVVAQAPVAALAEASATGVGGGAVEALLGGTPAAVPDRYAVADPVALVPSGARTVLVHGRADDEVPYAQSLAYAEVAGCELEQVPGGHRAHLDPTSVACAVLCTALAGL